MTSLSLTARILLASSASAFALLAAPALAQTVPDTSVSQQQGNSAGQGGDERSGGATSGTTQSAATGGIEEIVVTAQRQAESLQDVPIAVSAFSAESLERQQIENTSDLQLTLPNVTFTKSNFTGANFTIRGVGDAAVAGSSDRAVAIHINDMPLTDTRIFETEFFDLERLEVLRGPQGTLFGRNASSGVINFITARPNLDEFQVRGEAEYGNYDSIRVQGMVNMPISDILGARLAGFFLKRDGYTRNLFDGSRIDDRELWAVRGTVRFQPTESTTLDIIGYHFNEDDNRSRIQKQLCNRDPTGVLGCAPDRLEFEPINGNATLGGTIASREFLSIVAPGLAPFALGSVYGTDIYSGLVNPADLRAVSIDYNPTYRAKETIIQGRLEQELGEQFNLTMTGGYSKSSVSSRTDYNLTAANPFGNNAGLATFRAVPLFDAAEARLFQGNDICVSQADRSYVGFIGGKIDRCAPFDINFDESNTSSEAYSLEGHIDSSFDGPLNFLLGAIYLKNSADFDYFVNSTSLDYGAALLGGGVAALGPPMYNNETNRYRLKSYGIFGEGYWDISETLKLTVGARYSNDKKFVRDRVVLYNFPIPYGTQNAFDAPASAGFDGDPSRAGAQPFRIARVNFDEITGRAVLDWKPVTTFSDDTLVYLSYSRGYKSGGINPPFNAALFTAPVTFQPEIINAFEIGTKNTFGGGTFRANLTGFYYDYKDLQISRILNRTSFNDNTDASIWGIEGEFLLAPAPELLFNINVSYLNTKVKDLSLADTRDPSGGRSDTVIIKDITNASNCVVVPTTPGNAAGANTLVTAFNSAVGLQAPVPVPGTNTTGAYSICSALASTIQNPSAPLRTLFNTPTGSLPFQFNTNLAGNAIGLPDGVPVDLDGNELPQSPNWKFSVGAQYTADFANDMNAVFRVDYAFTGDYFARTFNKPIDRIESFDVINAQVQLNGPDQRWFVRAFVQNIENDDSIVGHYVTDPSSGMFTNVFTLEPRRYGVAAGFRF